MSISELRQKQDRQLRPRVVARAKQVYGGDVTPFDLTLMVPKIHARLWPDGDSLGTIRCRKCNQSRPLKYNLCSECRMIEVTGDDLLADGEQARRDAFDQNLADRFE